jgi:hypothetical protein
MKYLALTFAITLTGCGAINGTMNATEQMPAKMDDTIGQMKRTNETVEQQPVEIALEKMLDPQNGVALNPIPFDIMPYAETFGKYATTDQIVKIVYLWMQKLNMRVPDQASPTPDQVATFNQQQNQTFYALESICGLLPDDKVEQIVHDEIVGAGRFKNAALQMLMLRVRFIRDVLIHASLLSEPIDNVGKLEYGVNYANSIDYIARLPFAAEVSVDIYGFLPPLAEVKETLTPQPTALGAWTDIKSAIQIPTGLQSVTGDPNQDKQLAAQEKARQDNAMATINAKIKSWGGMP